MVQVDAVHFWFKETLRAGMIGRAMTDICEWVQTSEEGWMQGRLT